MGEFKLSKDPILVEVIYADEHKQLLLEVQVQAGQFALEVLKQSGIDKHFSDIDLLKPDSLSVGVFSKKIDVNKYQVQEGDRLELYRPLKIDPKDSRRLKADKGEN